MVAKIDYTGHKYNRLTAIRFDHYKNNNSMWLFRCDCGTEKVIAVAQVRSLGTKSCGCYNKEVASKRFRKHGKTETKEYKTWSKMKARCSQENDASYERYGNRGIKVCDRWLESFQNFYDDMGDAPTPKHSIDRIDNDGDYCPENCRWATQEEQNNNYSRNMFIEIGGKKQSLRRWCTDLNISYSIAYQRIRVLSWTPEQALGLTNRETIYDYSKNDKFVFVEVDGVKKHISEWAKEYGLNPKLVYKRYHTHRWPIKQALGIEPRVQGEKRP